MSRLAITFVLVCAFGCAADTPAVPAEAATLPADVRRALNTDPAILACASAGPNQPVRLLDEWFVQTPLARTRKHAGGLLVEATEPCLRSQGNPLWLYQSTQEGWRLDRRLVRNPSLRYEWLARAALGAYPAGTVPAMPQRLLGRWLPRSAAYFALEPLVISNEQLAVARCAGITFQVLEASGESALIELATGQSCAALQGTERVIRLTLGNSGCELTLTTFASAAKAQSEALSTWGLFDRPDCP